MEAADLVSADADYPRWFFTRDDQSPDASFYGRPRLVTHIDDSAIAAVGALYAELGVDRADVRVLDLMSSWSRTCARRRPNWWSSA